MPQPAPAALPVRVVLPPLQFVVDIVAFETGVSAVRIRGAGRSRPDVRARFAVCWAARELLGKPCQDIGRFLGDRDHSTITHALSRAEHMVRRDPAFRRLSEKLRTAVAEYVA